MPIKCDRIFSPIDTGIYNMMTRGVFINRKTCIELIKGIATNFQVLRRFAIRSTGGSDSARYCYSVWLRHLCMANRNGLSTRPETVAELGPGDSMGMGIAALITGAKKYYAFDVVEYASDERNIRVFEELVALFRRREEIPEESEFPGIKPDLDSYGFPHDILSGEYLDKTMSDERLHAIKNAIMNLGQSRKDGTEISYIVPWDDMNIIKNGSVDMIFSQAVLEHINNPVMAYEAQRNWLKSRGYMSHQIDFSSHGTASEWNGHWAYPDLMWKIILGKRPYPLNREPHSSHVSYLNKLNFEIICNVSFKDTSGIDREDLSSGFSNMSDEDIHTAGAFIQAVKK